MERVCWIDVMGAPECYVDAVIDETNERVLVTDETLAVMAEASRTSGIFNDEDAGAMVAAINEAPVVEKFREVGGGWEAERLRDVTEVGGGWDHWQDMRPERA